MFYILICYKSTHCVNSGYMKELLEALFMVNMQHFQRKCIKTFKKTSVGLMLFPLHLGYFISHWITNQILLTKLRHRPLTHNYVVWIMAVYMKYRHLDSVYFFSFMCLKETEIINGICLGIVRKGIGSVQERMSWQICFVNSYNAKLFTPLHTYFDVWYIATDVTLTV